MVSQPQPRRNAPAVKVDIDVDASIATLQTSDQVRPVARRMLASSRRQLLQLMDLFLRGPPLSDAFRESLRLHIEFVLNQVTFLASDPDSFVQNAPHEQLLPSALIPSDIGDSVAIATVSDTVAVWNHATALPQLHDVALEHMLARITRMCCAWRAEDRLSLSEVLACFRVFFEAQ